MEKNDKSVEVETVEESASKVKTTKPVKKQDAEANQTPNFDIPNGMDLEAYFAQRLEQAKNEMRAERAEEEVNEIKIGLKLQDKNYKEGAEIIDKKTNRPQLDENGQVKKYATRFYGKFVFMGGAIETELNEKQYNELEVNAKYLCKGYMGDVKDFGKTTTQPIFNDFKRLG